MSPRSLPKVALVDDDAAFLMSLAASLEAMAEEFDLEVATGGQQAAALLRAQPIAVLVTDLHMPVMDGIVLLEIARTISPPPVAIVITADVSTETAERLAPFQPLAILDKPVDLAVLIAVIRTALGRRRDSAHLADSSATSPDAMPSAQQSSTTLVEPIKGCFGALLECALQTVGRRGRLLLAPLAGVRIAARSCRW